MVTNPTLSRLPRRAIGSCLGEYGYLAASSSSMVTPCPGDSPQCNRPSRNVIVVRKHLVGLSWRDASTPECRSSAPRCRNAAPRPCTRATDRSRRESPYALDTATAKSGEAPHVRDAARVHDGRADVIDELILDQVLAIPDRVEHLADGQRRNRVLSNQLERPSDSPPASHPPARTGDTARGRAPGAPLRSASCGDGHRAAARRHCHDRCATARTACGTISRYFGVDHNVSSGSSRLGRLISLAAARRFRTSSSSQARRIERGLRETLSRCSGRLHRWSRRCRDRSRAHKPTRLRANDHRAFDSSGKHPRASRRCPTAPRRPRRWRSSSPGRDANRRRDRRTARCLRYGPRRLPIKFGTMCSCR